MPTLAESLQLEALAYVFSDVISFKVAVSQ